MRIELGISVAQDLFDLQTILDTPMHEAMVFGEPPTNIARGTATMLLNSSKEPSLTKL